MDIAFPAPHKNERRC